MKKGRFNMIISIAVLIAISAAFVMVMSTTYAADKGKMAGPVEKTIIGYVRDSYCFLTMGAKGEKHRECAVSCAKAGIAQLIEEEKTGKLYLVLPKSDDTSPALLNYCEKKVKVTGPVFNHGGISAIKVMKIEAVK